MQNARRARWGSALAVCVCSVGVLAAPVPLRADHPALGNWKLELPRLVCVETYLIRADGTTIVTSGDEVSESEFELADAPDAEGFYRWADTIVRDNGKADCVGHVTPIGDVATNYLRIEDGGERMFFCADRTTKSCVGPLVHVRPRRAS